MGEKWKPVVGYEGSYEVSDRGQVRSLPRTDPYGRRRRGGVLSQRKAVSNHRGVSLSANGQSRTHAVHHLVLIAFIGPRPQGMEACHWNDDPTDNRLENLRWDTRSANQLDSVRNGTHHMARVTQCPKGHPYTPENTYLYPPTGRRACRECRRIYRETHAEERRIKGREYARRKRAEAKALAESMRKAA